MNMRTKVASVWGGDSDKLEECVREEIASYKEKGYGLRGTPVSISSKSSGFFVLLTFEKPKEESTISSVCMNMSAEVVTVSGRYAYELEERINDEIAVYEKNEYNLRGTPVELYSGYSGYYVILTFERPE